MNNNLKNCTSQTLHEYLSACTIGANKESLPYTVEQIISEYISRSLPGVEINNLKKINSKASLNSVSATAEIKYGSIDESVFIKIHIETDANKSNALGLENEYANFLMLDNAGWPMLQPLYASLENEYKLLLYPRVYDQTLFEMLYESYSKRQICLPESYIVSLESMNKYIGEAYQKNIVQINSNEFDNSPVNNLFLRRIEEGGRCDKWYNENTLFKLDGIEAKISWHEIKDLKWEINDIEIESSLSDLIIRARKNLLGQNNSSALFGAISHGDDHAGNIFVSNERAYLFDPAFAGLNPIILSDIKAFAHICVLPLFGMYYDSHVKNEYRLEGKKIKLTTNALENRIQELNIILAKQIVDFRIIPGVKLLVSKGANLEQIWETMKSAFFCCGFLTINASMNDSKAMASNNGLLAISIILGENVLLPQLEYLKSKIFEING